MGFFTDIVCLENLESITLIETDSGRLIRHVRLVEKTFA